MDQNEEYFEEVSEDEVEFGQQEEVVDVVAPMPIEVPLDLQVAPLADNPQSPFYTSKKGRWMRGLPEQIQLPVLRSMMCLRF